MLVVSKIYSIHAGDSTISPWKRPKHLLNWHLPPKIGYQLPVTTIFFGFSSTTCGLHHAGYSRWGKRPVIAVSVGVKRADAVRMAPASRSGRLGWGIPTVFPRENPQMIPGWWFQRFFIFTPIFGEMIQFDSYFSDGLKPPTRWCWWSRNPVNSPVEVGRLSHYLRRVWG